MAERGLGVPARIERAIVRLRGQSVMLDEDLARLYEIETKNLIRAVKRNRARFPGDFLLVLSTKEAAILRCQFGTSSLHGGRRYVPFAFTEQGVAMLSSVLHTPRAIAVNIQIMRTFVRLRRLLDSNAGLAQKLVQLERKYDDHFKVVFDAIRQLMAPLPKSVSRIGFRRS